MERVPNHETRRTLSAVSRDKSAPSSLVVGLEDGRYRTLGTGREMKAEENRKKVLAALEVLGAEQEPKAIADASGTGTRDDPRLSAATISRTLAGLLERKQITRTGAGRKGDPFRYSFHVPT